MRYFKKKPYEDTTVRQIRADDGITVLGVVGTTGDLISIGLLSEPDDGGWVNHETWMCFPLDKDGKQGKPGLGDTRELAVKNTLGN